MSSLQNTFLGDRSVPRDWTQDTQRPDVEKKQNVFGEKLVLPRRVCEMGSGVRVWVWERQFGRFKRDLGSANRVHTVSTI